MNPYLLIQQTTKRASAYFYSQYVLAEEWAEVPESQTAPTIKVDLLEETPLGEAVGEVSTDPLAEAVLGLYLDDQLVGKAPFTKALTTDPASHGQEFIYEPDPDWLYPEFLDSIKTIDLEMMMETKDFWSKVTHALADAAEMWEPPPPTTIRLAETNAKIYEALMAHKDLTLFEIPDPNNPRGTGTGEVGIVFGIWTKDFPRKQPPFPIFAVVQIGGHDTYSTIYFDAEHAVTTGYAWMADMGIPMPKDLDMTKTANALKARVKSVMARLSSDKSAPRETPPPPTIYKSPWED